MNGVFNSVILLGIVFAMVESIPAPKSPASAKAPAPAVQAKVLQSFNLQAKFDDFVERATEAANPPPIRYNRELKELLRQLENNYMSLKDMFDNFMDELDAAPLPNLRNYACTVVHGGIFFDKCNGGSLIPTPVNFNFGPTAMTTPWPSSANPTWQ